MRVFAVSLQLRPHWDRLYDGGRVVEQLDSKTVITQYSYRPPVWAAPVFNHHDFLAIRTERTEPDGTIIVLSRSVVHQVSCLSSSYRKGSARKERLSSFGTRSLRICYSSMWRNVFGGYLCQPSKDANSQMG